MHEHKFDSKGKIYVKGRPDYPEALFWYLLAERIIDKEKTVADIGSGTGIFTAQIAPFVKSVMAVEPNGDMRNKAEDRFKTFANITSVNATAESTSLPNNSVDIITVAQAFHWFDRELFKKECQRILKPAGTVILVWNDRDSTSEIIKDNFAVNKKFCPDFKGSSNGIDFSKEGFSDFFAGEFEMTEFDNCLIYDKEAFINRNLSSSYAPKENEAHYSDYINAISQVFDNHSENGKIRYPYVTRCYIGKI